MTRFHSIVTGIFLLALFLTINVASAAIPTITGVSPASGPADGGTMVIINGTGFTGATDIHFGANPASFNVDTDTQINATSPAGTAGTVDVTVTTPDGTSPTSSADQFTYIAPPAITGVSPASGPVDGGTIVIINGTGFTGATDIHFGANSASFNVDSDTQINTTSPAGVAGTVDVTVTTPNGTSATSPADQFTYIAAPMITGISPASGPVAGGTMIIVTGTGFTGATSLMFGTIAATSFTVDSDTRINATSPAGSAGTVHVTVTTPDGTSATSSADQFTYATVILPTITGISPTSGSVDGGTIVIINGTGFTGATSLVFGSTEATSFTVDSDTQINTTSPAGVVGTVDVTVTTPQGTSATSTADQFTYLPSSAPAITGVSPTSGPVAGGTIVIINGTGFTGATGIHFGTTPVTSFTVNSDTRITTTSPAGSAGTVHVTVTTPQGTSAPSNADQFTYLVPEEQALSVTLKIRPNTLNLGSKGVFTVYVTLNGGESPFPLDGKNKPYVDFANSSLTCSGAEMMSASSGVSNKGGGTLIAKFHRQDLENVTSGPGVQINCSGTLDVNGKSVVVEGSDTIRVLGEKKGLDKFISGFLKYLGLEKDDIAVTETGDGNVTLSVTLNPDMFKNNGQAKKAVGTREDASLNKGQNTADKTTNQNQNALKNNGRDKNNNSKDDDIQQSDSDKNDNRGNKNTNKGNDASQGKANGKKDK
jgi:hypothetical protein